MKSKTIQRLKVAPAFYTVVYNVALWVLKRTYPAVPTYVKIDGKRYRPLPVRWSNEGDCIVGTLAEEEK